MSVLEEDSSFMELQNVRKKAKTEEATFTNPIIIFKEKVYHSEEDVL